VNRGEVRYRYRLPLWMGVAFALSAALFWNIGLAIPGFWRALFWLFSATFALGVLVCAVGLANQSELVLTEVGLTVPIPLRRPRFIDITEIDKFRLRDTSTKMSTQMAVDIGTPTARITLGSMLFANDRAFLEALAAIGDRVTAAGGPELVEFHPRPPGFR
jgi:hypothetical protein